MNPAIVLIVSVFGLLQAKNLGTPWIQPINFEPVSPGGGRITGGEEAVPNSIPYQVGLFITKTDGLRYFCGGSLISHNCVITAAHCAYQAVSIEIVLGAHKIQEVEPQQKRYVTENFVHHENYNPNYVVDDIAMVYTPERVEFSDAISPIALPTWKDVNEDFSGDFSQQSGWGKTSDGSSGIADKLQAINTTIITNQECNDMFFGMIEDCHICTETIDGKSPCNGDSGGPLVSEDQKLVGLASFVIGFGCEIEWPAAFCRVTHYLKWIEDHSDVTIRH